MTIPIADLIAILPELLVIGALLVGGLAGPPPRGMGGPPLPLNGGIPLIGGFPLDGTGGLNAAGYSYFGSSF